MGRALIAEAEARLAAHAFPPRHAAPETRRRAAAVTPTRRFRMVSVLPMVSSVNRNTALCVILALLAAATPALALEPAIARPSFPIGGEIRTSGLVFFIATDGPRGAAAIGTAHTFALRDLSKVKRGEFLLGHSRHIVSQSSGFLVPPGQPFDDTAGGLADDYVVYRLESRPTGVRLLKLAATAAQPGDRVRILGVPSAVKHDEDDIFGLVTKANLDRIDIELDVPFSLKGWGGAPVLDIGSGEVVGMIQANLSATEAVAGPVQRMRAALEAPLEAGRGRAFSEFALLASGRRERSSDRTSASSARSESRAQGEALIRHGFADKPRLHIAVEYPTEGAVVGNSSCGTFVSGRATALHGEMLQFDVMFVIDTSLSAGNPAGADINGNGELGRYSYAGVGALLEWPITDPGDSILAAEVAAARQLLHGLDPRSTRVGVISFAGQPPDANFRFGVQRPEPPAVTLQPLTDDFSKAEYALDQLLEIPPAGATHMAAGLDLATTELRGLPGSLSRENTRSEKIVLFFTDGQPTLPHGVGFDRDNIDSVLRAANRAGRASIQVHSFAIGPDALSGPMAVVEMASRTDGFFTPVRHPGDLVDVVEEVSFANLENVRLRSLTTGNPADHFRATADGSWAGFVTMKPGKNQIEVRARTSDGLERAVKLNVTMREDAQDPNVPTALVVARNRLLEDCLRDLKRGRVTAEHKRAEDVRRELLLEIAKERDEARTRAAAQKKRLKLDVEDTDDAEPGN